jgi:mRNA-degrading endonuclease YafQ of YafQ-DinJ toxin-antitoxin module
VPYTITFTERYTRIAAQFLKHHPDMARAYKKTLALLQANSQRPSLRMHPLGGRLQGVHSVSIILPRRVSLTLLV